ncbi:MAG: F0F1 ATP synthase subunit delta [Nocardioidaceae bacterium]
MQAGSARSQATVLDAVDEQLRAGPDLIMLGDDLYAVAAILDTEGTLRRVLTEPAVAVEAKTTLVTGLLEGKIGDPALSVVLAAIRYRWSRGRDLADALERAGITAQVAKAEQTGQLDNLEDDLFRFGRILEAQPGLRDALADPAAPLEGKRELLHHLLEGKVGESTKKLLDQAVTGRHRTLAATLTYYQTVAAARRKRLVATAWVAAPLSDDHKQRLARALAEQCSREIHLNVVVDPNVLGGVRVALGDEVIDSTIETRLAQAYRRLAS